MLIIYTAELEGVDFVFILVIRDANQFRLGGGVAVNAGCRNNAISFNPCVLLRPDTSDDSDPPHLVGQKDPSAALIECCRSCLQR